MRHIQPFSAPMAEPSTAAGPTSWSTFGTWRQAVVPPPG